MKIWEDFLRLENPDVLEDTEKKCCYGKNTWIYS